MSPQPAPIRSSRRSLAKVLPLLAAALFFAGCQTPPAAKELSRQQITTISSAEKAYQLYTAAVVNFANGAAAAATERANLRYNDRKQQMIARHQSDPSRLADEIEKARHERDEDVAYFNAQVALLQQSTQELARFWPRLLAAQKEIDTYLATPRPDQRIAGELMGMLKLDQENLETQAKTIADKLTNLSRR